ncbi:PstS family phosphate ABC transporter substrate-binding protein [Flavobacterium lacus]|uniref:Phosphate ABC transporter substrate-binding protein (PhoT family) n=1 Tax=Flavobacterium lacus TaxID=1353778 RepID=A0A328WRB4_9FLAO|nr:substrate-binding domain-containing protein [Flavobacterium lacus]RAR47646.1 phosphate ABC transporter substrate-binding protein (PhoT family) [Flavobacterium lacus]
MKSFLFLVLFFLLSSCYNDNHTIKIKGSDTEVNLAVLLAERYHLENTSLLVSVSGGGSGLGIASLLNGNADIANSSRSIKYAERALFERKKIAIDSFVFAQDAIAFVVSDKLPIDSISTKTITNILNGNHQNWSSIIPLNQPITIYGRQSNSGTHDYVKSILGIQFSPHAMQMNGNAQIIEALKVDNSGFGYVSAGYVLNGNAAGLKILPVFHEDGNAFSPLDVDAIASGHYFFQRPLYQYYRKKDYQKIKPFLDFEKSETGAKIIQQSGYYPLNK